MELKVRDRVVADRNFDGNNTKGQKGTVKKASVSSQYNGNILVNFDKDNVNWWMPKQSLKLIVTPFEQYIGDKFFNKRVSVVKNGNIFKLIKTDGKVLYTYIPKQGISKIATSKNKTELMYIELFEQAIEEFNKSKE